MDVAFLLAATNTKGSVGMLSQAALAGDGSALYPLHDALLEEGFDMESDLKIGQYYYIETVTHYWVGKLVKASFAFLVLEESCKMYDTGQFTDFMNGSMPSEAQPIPDGLRTVIPVCCITGVIDWPHKPFRKIITGGSYAS